MSMLRCPACGKATVVVDSRKSPLRCEHCRETLDDAEPLSGSDPESLELRVRERLYGRHGLNRSRART